MTTILPSSPPPRSRRRSAPSAPSGHSLRRAAVVLVVVLLAAGAAVFVTRARTEALPPADAPSGRQRPLTTEVSLPGGLWAPGFRVKLPAEPTVLEQPGWDAGAPILSAPLGSPGSHIVFARIENVRDVDEAMERLGRVGTLGPTRVVSVAGRAGMTRDVTLADGRVAHEYRWQDDGIVYGIGIVTKAGDDVAYDTGLAAMATFEIR